VPCGSPLEVDDLSALWPRTAPTEAYSGVITAGIGGLRMGFGGHIAEQQYSAMNVRFGSFTSGSGWPPLQPRVMCGRQPCDAHHLRFAQDRALGRKVSDEFTVPLCRGHHRELHRHGDEAAWWQKLGLDPTPTARTLWLQTHPLGAHKLADVATDSLVRSRPTSEGVG
jgi:hypothetical protein